MEVKDFVTFGASARVRKSKENYKECLRKYSKLYNKMETRRVEVNANLKVLVEEKIVSLRSLKKIERISKNLIGKDRKFNIDGLNLAEYENFKTIEKTISMGDAAINTVKGTISGISTGVGAWASSINIWNSLHRNGYFKFEWCCCYKCDFSLVWWRIHS